LGDITSSLLHRQNYEMRDTRGEFYLFARPPLDPNLHSSFNFEHQICQKSGIVHAKKAATG
jgi:hypothetical protein